MGSPHSHELSLVRPQRQRRLLLRLRSERCAQASIGLDSKEGEEGLYQDRNCPTCKAVDVPNQYRDA